MGDSKLLWWQRQRLQKQLHQTRDARVYRRTLALLEYDRGHSVSQIARRLGVARLSVYRWIEAFAQAPPPQCLGEGARSGRPRQLGEDSARCLSLLFQCSPQDWGYPDANWTVPLLANALGQQIGCRCGEGPVRRAVHDLGYVWKRSRYVLAPDPEREKKKRRILQELGHLSSRSVILAEDETDVLLFPPLRAAWGQRGQAITVLLSGLNARRVIFGGLNLRTGKRLFLERKRQRQEDFEAFLDLLHEHYRAWDTFLLLDEDPSHTGEEAQVLAEAYGIELVWLPKRAPELNPMDWLWGQAKSIVSANRQYGTIEELVDLLLDYLESLSDGDALSKSGVLSPDFWLKSIL